MWMVSRRARQIGQQPLEELSVLPDLDPVAFDQRAARERDDRRQLLFERRAVRRLELERAVVEDRPQQQEQERDDREQAVEDGDVDLRCGGDRRSARRPSGERRRLRLNRRGSAGGSTRWRVALTGQ